MQTSHFDEVHKKLNESGLLEQQKAEIARMRATFDYSVFAGKKGPLSGPDSLKGSKPEEAQ